MMRQLLALMFDRKIMIRSKLCALWTKRSKGGTLRRDVDTCIGVAKAIFRCDGFLSGHPQLLPASYKTCDRSVRCEYVALADSDGIALRGRFSRIPVLGSVSGGQTVSPDLATPTWLSLSPLQGAGPMRISCGLILQH